VREATQAGIADKRADKWSRLPQTFAEIRDISVGLYNNPLRAKNSLPPMSSTERNNWAVT
jgi:hypothetical protein